ncbi:Lrp/AsnC family transcriptional regulator [Thermococcus sp. M39]|uniref:Lrp/AsnC ligand binding domain-containing protein n=1 Tax=unclassified Thermococcus TaxID=2627626 RepID=UPI00143AB8F2|nr:MULTISPECIES: Lrp/AsnC ligand binding domain-containing protein [unclassified Thermococcus]NJE09290.1 Lrp/AsnC family transcriptional regulator [Thermococcus sp. M39]NJE13868.1 Lrp/AsnC family transcriptional regulator [Thermococcus sp. LS2]
MVRAYALLTVDVGRIEKVLEEVKAIQGVVKADTMARSYDAIVEVEAADLEELERIIRDMRNVDGVLSVITEVVGDLEEE